MCGITGFFSPEKEIETSKYYGSHLLVKHRGPDDEGFIVLDKGILEQHKGDDTITYFENLRNINSVKSSKLILGHRRLSIIDLSHQGHQPFTDKSKRYYIVYNGEIFNYLELKDELKKYGYTFCTNSDTEVVLTAYIQWGDKAFNKFNGMWAIAIYDAKEGSIILSRDRFGVKPLFYSMVDGVLYFASEMKFLISFVPHKFSVNHGSVNAYIKRSLVSYSRETFWNEIHELEPAHFLTFRNKKVNISCYWDYEPRVEYYSEDDAIEKFSLIFNDSLKLRMRSDVEVGTLLSGGLDSTTIVCALHNLGLIKNGSFKSFSAVFEDERFSERRFIDETIKSVNIKPYSIYPKAEDLSKYINKLLYYAEEPFRSLSMYSQFMIYEKIKADTDVKVVLNGQGADELFGGYTNHYYSLFAHLLRRLKVKKMLREMNLFHLNKGVLYRNITKQTLKQFLQSLFQYNYFNNVTFLELKRSALREYLKYDDRTSMAYGIEARTPFLDYRLVEFAFSLDVGFKIDNFVNKRIERQYAKNFVPEAIINRTDKMGFVSPQEVWQKNELREQLVECFNEIRQGYLSDILNVRDLSRRYNLYKEGRFNDWAYIWRIYCFYKWAKLNMIN